MSATYTHYTLTADEAARYDSRDDRESSALMRELAERFGRDTVTTEVYHPEDFVVGVYGPHQ